MLDASLPLILSGLLLGGLGFLLFIHGKRESDLGTLFGGIALGLLPMAVHSLALLWALSAAVLGSIMLLKRHTGSGTPLA